MAILESVQTSMRGAAQRGDITVLLVRYRAATLGATE